LTTLKKQGSAMGLERASIEWNTYRQKPGQTLITCSEPMAVLLVDALREIGIRAGERGGKTELVIACASGVAAASTAIDAERTRPANESPAGHTKPALN
jgi:hypothetical protein